MTNNNKQDKKMVQTETVKEPKRTIIHTSLERVMIKSARSQIKKETTKSGNEITSSK